MAEPMKMQLINMIPMIGTATLVGHVFSGFVISACCPNLEAGLGIFLQISIS